jgi:hypothetical protein
MLVFFGFLASLFGLIAGFALVTFTPAKQVTQPTRLFLTGFCVGGIAALGWSPMVVSGEVSTLAYLIIVGILVVCGALISLLGSSKAFTVKMIDEPVDRSDRDEWNDRGFGGGGF